MTTSPPPASHDDAHGGDVLGDLAAEVGGLAGDPLVAAPGTSAPDPHEGHDHGPTADVSVRPAIPEDAALVTRVQLQAWQHRGLLGAADLAAIDTRAAQAQWHAGITAPPSSRHRVLAACEGSRVVGFAAFAPATTSELPAAGPVGEAVEVLALEVLAGHTRHGHGSRLLAACVDLAVETGVGTVLTWCGDGDDARQRFLDTAGFAPAGLRRELPAPDGVVVEHCWYTRV